MLESLRITDFRCLAAAEFAADSHYNLVYGANASGKTSLLEAIAYLGRARSFRGAGISALIRHGRPEILLQGKATVGHRSMPLGIRNGRNGLEMRVDGQRADSAAALAEALPLQIVDPNVYNLVAGGPESRRRYVDWIAFHVEHRYLEYWRRFRRVLKQRNAALREGASTAALSGWDREFLESAMRIHDVRQQVVEGAAGVFEEVGRALLGGHAGLEYRSGWKRELSLEEALLSSAERDREHGGTQVGPHRGELRLVLGERQARHLVSRGQQKLLACALILTATKQVQCHLQRPLLLLLDDPAAELDSVSLQRLMEQVIGLGSQVIATALVPDTALFPQPPALFHVEHGALRRVE